MRYENNDRLREYLDRGAAGAYREHLRHPRFEFNEEAFAAALDQVCAQFPDLAPEDAQARAAFRLLTSGVAPDVAVPLPSRWFRATRLVREKSLRSWPWVKLAWAVAVLALCVTAVVLLSALVARAEPTPQNLRAYGNALRGFSLLPAAAAPQQPGGIILQFQQAGSPLATRPAGLVAFNCSTGLNCSFSGTTFTLTSTGAGGTGCVPPGTPSRFLYDDGAGGCLDTGFTWTSGTSTATAPSGVTLTYSGTGIINARNWAGTGITNGESLGKIPIGNGDGTASWADPFVSGITPHDAVGTGTNPVLLGGYASAAAPSNVSADGDAVRGWFLRNGVQVGAISDDSGALASIAQLSNANGLNVRPLNNDGDALSYAVGDGPATVNGVAALWQDSMGNMAAVSAATPLPVSVGSSALPTGASTLAEQQTQTTSLQLIDNIVSGAGANISQINGVNVTMGNGVSGTGVQRVTIASDSTGQVAIASLPNEGQQTMANSISVAIASNQSAIPVDGSGVTQPVSGTVTVTDGAGALNVICDSGCAGSGGTSAADNSAFTGGATNVTPIGAIYDNTPPTITDGDVGAPRMDSSRQLLVNCAVGCGGSSFSDNAAFTFGTTAISPMGAVVDDTATNTVSENSAGSPRMNTNRILYANPRNNAGTEIFTASAPGSVDLRQIGGGSVSTAATGIQKVGIVGSSAEILNVSGQNVTPPQGWLFTGCQFVTSPTTITTGNGSPLECTSAGNLKADITTINGVAPLMGNGASGTGAQRVTIANDSTGIIALTTGSAQIGHLEANQSVNLAQVAGGTTSTVATGVQKVGIADSGGTAFLSAANALNSTGSGVQAVQVVGQCDDTSPTALTENQFGNVRMGCTTHYLLVDGSAVTQPISAASLPLPTGAATETTLATLSLAQGSSTSGQKGPLAQGAVTTSAPTYTNGQTSPLSLDTTGALRVAATVNAGSLTIKNSSNVDTCVGYYATTPCLNLPVQMASEHTEDSASASGDYGVFVHGVRTDTLADQTSATGDYGGVSVDSLGRVLSIIAPHAAMVRGTATTTGTSDTSLVSAGGASVKNYITAVQCANSGATTAVITFKDGAAGSTLAYTIVPAGGGSNIVYPVPLVTTANTAFYFAAGSSSTTVYCSAQGYKAP